MASLTVSQVAEYFHHIHKAVDGLWFTKNRNKLTKKSVLEKMKFQVENIMMEPKQKQL
jgi:hypothetical protein